MTGTKAAATLLRELREKRAVTLREVARGVGVAPSQLSRIERGERSASEAVSGRLADYYGVHPDVVRLVEAGLPEDVVAILHRYPELIERVRCWALDLDREGEATGGDQAGAVGSSADRGAARPI